MKIRNTVGPNGSACRGNVLRCSNVGREEDRQFANSPWYDRVPRARRSTRGAVSSAMVGVPTTTLKARQRRDSPFPGPPRLPHLVNRSKCDVTKNKEQRTNPKSRFHHHQNRLEILLTKHEAEWSRAGPKRRHTLRPHAYAIATVLRGSVEN
ncbi:hypothetical protein MPTK1_1g13530 [Marchantia polymorpha subsp. ruderalis]|uniref:Uncharacterized protein n=2 Tax=Marchantia polymorpha TaxID=3197 RepID=A0AAF6APR6_MARPO|nr:hypothetical protein MARPO_0019s0123 [Marchantia polymorpha]BBM98436.1 hypothetical protein Mp_1g13530 [Marchantia polymorpha subsp. ruderalis]|eukprot:PTQ44706.1 hypothetical protein MARPO_0019s0123 [Marchantia polymorpha]